jgi:hypothetical protein
MNMATRIWLRGSSGRDEPHNSSFAQSLSVDENDPALVAMRARRVVADLNALRSAQPGELAFPKIVRGELIGPLVCGNKEHAEAYAPDEIEPLRNMAAAVGHALDALRVRELEERQNQPFAGGLPPSPCSNGPPGGGRANPSYDPRKIFRGNSSKTRAAVRRLDKTPR